MKMKIEFFWNGGFAGISNSMVIDGKTIDLGLGITNSEDDARDKIKEILKRDYNLIYSDDDIVFKWGGRL